MTTGLLADVIITFIYTFATNTWLTAIMDLHTMPPEFLPNATTTLTGGLHHPGYSINMQ